MHSKGMPMTGPMIIGKAKSFYDKIKKTDKCTFFEDKWTFFEGSNKNYLQELKSV
jgi:hypothetical protein